MHDLYTLRLGLVKVASCSPFLQAFQEVKSGYLVPCFTTSVSLKPFLKTYFLLPRRLFPELNCTPSLVSLPSWRKASEKWIMYSRKIPICNSNENLIPACTDVGETVLSRKKKRKYKSLSWAVGISMSQKRLFILALTVPRRTYQRKNVLIDKISAERSGPACKKTADLLYSPEETFWPMFP